MRKVNVHVSMYVDPALSNKDGSDKTAITVVGTSPMDVWYVIAAVTTVNNNPTEVAAAVKRIASRYRPMTSGLEIVGAQSLYLEILVPVFREIHLPPIRGYTVTSRRSKQERIMRVLEPRHRGGRLVFGRDMKALEDQVRQFPQLAHDDLIDSLSGHEHVARVPRTVLIDDVYDEAEEHFDEDASARLLNGSYIGRRTPGRAA